MTEIIQVTCKISLLKGRKKLSGPIFSGYRPLFYFKDSSTRLSGMITMLDREKLFPGETAIVKTSFIGGIVRDSYFVPGEKFTFSEALEVLGEGEILVVFPKIIA